MSEFLRAIVLLVVGLVLVPVSTLLAQEHRPRASTGGEVAVLEAGEVWEVLAVHEPGEPTRATPVPADGRLYVRTASRLYAFQTDERGESLGEVDFRAPCSPAVREAFDRAVALLHHMTYPVALDAFRDVAGEDPECALAYWGMAMTLFQPLWPTRPGDAELDRGWELVREARRNSTEDEREAMFIAAAEAFFDPSGTPDYWTRIERWADASRALYEAYPEDPEARAFFALSHLATASRHGALAEHHARAAEVLLEILDQVPRHPGAVHYTIHANDFAGRENESLSVVRSYGEIAPRNPHALHMPTHIFVRLGAWEDVIDWNLRAAEAALAQRVGPDGAYVWDELPHATEYLVYAYLQRGDDDAARRRVERLNDIPDLQPSFKTAFHLASTAARYALERKAWREAARLSPRSPDRIEWDRFRWPEAVTWFARGLGAVHQEDLSSAQESLDRLTALENRSRSEGEASFARQIEILRLELAAWHAHATGDENEAIRLMEEAIELEDRTPKHPVTPAPTVPARELMGDLRLATGDPQTALSFYRASLTRTPGRFNSLLGAARAAARIGDETVARDYYEQLLQVAASDSRRPEVEEASRFTGSMAARETSAEPHAGAGEHAVVEWRTSEPERPLGRPEAERQGPRAPMGITATPSCLTYP